jgi:plasmid stabilization system protein ParE
MGKQKETAAKTYQVRVSVNALQNIDEITGYIAFINQQPLNAIKVGDALLAAIENIGNHPTAYKGCEELPTKSKMYRKAICLSWTIVFRIKGSEVVILGIIHTARRPAFIKILKKVK